MAPMSVGKSAGPPARSEPIAGAVDALYVLLPDQRIALAAKPAHLDQTDHGFLKIQWDGLEPRLILNDQRQRGPFAHLAIEPEARQLAIIRIDLEIDELCKRLGDGGRPRCPAGEFSGEIETPAFSSASHNLSVRSRDQPGRWHRPACPDRDRARILQRSPKLDVPT